MAMLQVDLPAAIARARKLIAACERDLKRKLGRGECNDLLLDNTKWTRSDVVNVMDSIWQEPSAAAAHGASAKKFADGVRAFVEAGGDPGPAPTPRIDPLA